MLSIRFWNSVQFVFCSINYSVYLILYLLLFISVVFVTVSVRIQLWNMSWLLLWNPHRKIPTSTRLVRNAVHWKCTVYIKQTKINHRGLHTSNNITNSFYCTLILFQKLLVQHGIRWLLLAVWWRKYNNGLDTLLKWQNKLFCWIVNTYTFCFISNIVVECWHL